MKTNKNGNVFIIVLVSMVILFSLGIAGYFFMENQKLKMDKVPNSPSPTAYLNEDDSQSPTPTASAQVSTVGFNESDNFTTSEKSEITKKIINPYLDYYKDAINAGAVKKLLISKNTQASKADYPYKGEFELEGGGNGGFLIAKAGTGVDWWVPECLNGCTFSSAFKTKYPEIVESSN